MKNSVLFSVYFYFLCLSVFSQNSEIQTLDDLYQKPKKHNLVQDYASIFTVKEQRKLRHQLDNYHEKTTTEIQLLTVPSLEGRSIKTVSLNIANSWELGRKYTNNGVLIFWVKNDEKLRIELGQEISEIISDSEVQNWLQEIKPLLKKNDNYEASTILIQKITTRLGNNFQPKPTEKLTIFNIIIFVMIAIFVFYLATGANFSSKPTISLGIISLVIWLISGVLIIMKLNAIFMNLLIFGACELFVWMVIRLILSEREKQKDIRKKQELIIKKIEKLGKTYLKYDEISAQKWIDSQKHELINYRLKTNFYPIESKIDELTKKAQDLEKLHEYLNDEKYWIEAEQLYQKLPNLVTNYRAKLQRKYIKIPYQKSYCSVYFEALEDRIRLPFFDDVIEPKDIQINEISEWLEGLITQKSWKNYPIILENKKAQKTEIQFLNQKSEALKNNSKSAFLVFSEIRKRWKLNHKALNVTAFETFDKNTTNTQNDYSQNDEWDNYFDDAGNRNNGDNGGSFDGDGSDISWD